MHAPEAGRADERHVTLAGTTGVATLAMARIPWLDVLLGSRVVWAGLPGRRTRWRDPAVWGRKASGRRVRAMAARDGLLVRTLEDGFLRSWGDGSHYPPLCLVVDDVGIYYDCTAPSALEALLAGPADLLAGRAEEVARARQAILRHGLSKYNSARPIGQALGGVHPESGLAAVKVLVVDQTAGDLSVTLGGAEGHTFAAMLEAARAENPMATVYVKTHPEVSSGRKRGYLTHVRDDARTVVLREPLNPLDLVRQMDRVYVVSSTLGFEALLAGRAVTCFGMPWYAGWGVTDDRQACVRRSRTRSVDELFAAAYLDYTRYLDPETHQRGSIFHVIDWLVRQRQTVEALHGPLRDRRLIMVGMPRWKAANLKPLFALEPGRTVFASSVREVEQLDPAAGDWLVHWGAQAPTGLEALARRTGAQCVRMEDGFMRSVGLGSDLIPPMSLTLDRTGIYFDATHPSDLEILLNDARFSPQELEESRRVRTFIVEHDLTKYNLEPRSAARWPASRGRRVVLVPGQVEDDASIQLGCTGIRTNLALLEAVRTARPDAFIVYKPHPDVVSGNRAGRVAAARLRSLADHIETDLSVTSCLSASDEVHTMTSLCGFDALLRGKHVVTYGQPFYAGWGLTEDRCEDGSAFVRRRRNLSLDELVAGVLLRYPVYWDSTLKGYTTCMAVLRLLASQRDQLEATGQLEQLRTGWWRRQARKFRVWVKAWVSR